MALKAKVSEKQLPVLCRFVPLFKDVKLDKKSMVLTYPRSKEKIFKMIFELKMESSEKPDDNTIFDFNIERKPGFCNDYKIGINERKILQYISDEKLKIGGYISKAENYIKILSKYISNNSKIQTTNVNLWLVYNSLVKNDKKYFKSTYHIKFVNFLCEKIENSEPVKIWYYGILPEFVKIKNHKYLHYPEHFEKANKIIKDNNKRYNRIKNTITYFSYIILTIMFAVGIYIFPIILMEYKTIFYDNLEMFQIFITGL